MPVNLWAFGGAKDSFQSIRQIHVDAPWSSGPAECLACEIELVSTFLAQIPLPQCPDERCLENHAGRNGGKFPQSQATGNTRLALTRPEVQKKTVFFFAHLRLTHAKLPCKHLCNRQSNSTINSLYEITRKIFTQNHTQANYCHWTSITLLTPWLCVRNNKKDLTCTCQATDCEEE